MYDVHIIEPRIATLQKDSISITPIVAFELPSLNHPKKNEYEMDIKIIN